MDKIKYLEKELELLLGWIRAADGRISLVLPLSSAMLGVIATLASEVKIWTIWPAIISSFCVFFLILSVAFTAIASFPRTSGPKASMIFFQGIVERGVEKYRRDVGEFSENEYIDDLISQCHINAQIANTKFLWVKRGLGCLFISSLPWFLSVYALFGLK